MAPVALAFAILGRPGGSATELGLVKASSAAALVASLLAGGVLADRFPRYRVMAGSDLVPFAAQGAIAGLFIAGTAPLGLVAALAAVSGAAGGVSYPCLRGLIPQVVDGSQVQSANALIQLAQNSTRLLGASGRGCWWWAWGPAGGSRSTRFLPAVGGACADVRGTPLVSGARGPRHRGVRHDPGRPAGGVARGPVPAVAVGLHRPVRGDQPLLFAQHQRARPGRRPEHYGGALAGR